MERTEYFCILIISIIIGQLDILKQVKCQCFSLYSYEMNIISELSLTQEYV